MKKNLDSLFESLIDLNLREYSKTYGNQMALITVKSLLPQGDGLRNAIDYNRYLRELDLWLSYREDYNKTILNIKQIDRQTYFQEGDDSLFFRLVPIYQANEDKDFALAEFIKNLLFTTGSLEDIFQYILLFRFMVQLEDRQLAREDRLDLLKDYLIKISQEDFLETYGNFFRLEINKSYRIEFERTRLDLLKVFNGIETEGFFLVKDIINYMEARPLVSLELRALAEALEGEVASGLDQIYRTFNAYLLDLKKSRIARDQVYIKDYIMPDIFSLEEGELFFHSLLNHCQLIEKKEQGGILSCQIRSKTGIYRFKKEIN